MAELYFRQNVDEGLKELDKGKGISQAWGLVFYILQLDNINRRNANLHQMHKTAEH